MLCLFVGVYLPRLCSFGSCNKGSELLLQVVVVAVIVVVIAVAVVVVVTTASEGTEP
jgi:formate hydrogenlyase subunit 4